MPTAEVQSRRKNRFLRVNYLAKNSRRKDLKDSIEVVLKQDTFEEPLDLLPESELRGVLGRQDLVKNRSNTFHGTEIPASVFEKCTGYSPLQNGFLSSNVSTFNKCESMSESSPMVKPVYDNVPVGKIRVKSDDPNSTPKLNGSPMFSFRGVFRSAPTSPDFNSTATNERTPDSGVRCGSGPEQPAFSFGIVEKECGSLNRTAVELDHSLLKEMSLNGRMISNDSFNSDRISDADDGKIFNGIHRDVFPESNVQSDVKPCGQKARDVHDVKTGGSRIPRDIKAEGGDVDADAYEEEEYVEDLAQLDILLHYVNNLSASLEFLDWEKNKRISTDLVPTLLDIYDALYAKLADGSSAGDTVSATGHDNDVSGLTNSEEGQSAVEVSSIAAIADVREGNECTDDKTAKKRRTGLDGRDKAGPGSGDRTGERSNECEGNRRTDSNQCLSNRLSLSHSRERGVVNHEIRRLCNYCSSKKCSVVSKQSSVVDKCRCSELEEENSRNSETKENLNTSGLTPNQSNFLSPPLYPSDVSPFSTPLSSRLSQMSHPTLSHIPPRSPHEPRKLSTTSTNSINVYRPLSSISSSSSSSSNSLPRNQTGIHTSYLASVESLVENDDEGGAPGNRQPGVGGAMTKRRERSLKVRRDFRGHLSRPGSCDSGVAQCHSISRPFPTTTPTTSNSSTTNSTLSGGGGTGSSINPHHHQHLLPGSRYHFHRTVGNGAVSTGIGVTGGAPLKHMDRLVMEVLETEALYVHGLWEVIQGYLEPWLRGSEPGVTPQQATELFSNLREIHSFNSRFLAEMEWCGVDPVQLARVFVRNNAGFTIYTHYCTHYPRTVSLLTELMRVEESVSSFRERQLALGHTLPLGSYLLKPVQRILKYHLLLENILKHFDKEKDSEGYTVILNARNAMTGMAHHINDMKRRHEHCVRVQEIQSLLYGWPGADLTTFGELAAEGTFRIVSAKGLRHVFLFSKMLLICKKKEENFLVYKTHIMCSNLMLIESIPREPLCFQVIPFDNPRLQYTLQARNRDHKHEWTQQLKRLILENYSAEIPAHARQLVMELGKAKQDDCSPLSSSGGRRPSSLSSGPQYLQKRRRGRRASEQTPTNSGGASRLRIRRQSKDSAESGRSRSASRGRDTEEEEEPSRLSTPGDKPKLRLSMWRRKSEPNAPKNNRNANATPETPTTTKSSPSPSTDPTTPQSMYSTAPCTPTTTDGASDGLPSVSITTTAGGCTTNATPAMIVTQDSDSAAVLRLMSDSPPTAAGDGGVKSSLLAPPEIQVDNLSISECERDEANDEAEDELDDGDDTTTQENLEEIVSHLLQHNLHLQQLLLSKQRRGLLLRKKQSRITSSASAAYETSDTENDDLISHDSGLPITSISSMNSINYINAMTGGVGNNTGLESAPCTGGGNYSEDGDDESHSAMLDKVAVSEAGLQATEDGLGNYVNLCFSKKEPEPVTCHGFGRRKSSHDDGFARVIGRTSGSTYHGKRDECAGSSSDATSVYSSAVSISQHEIGKGLTDCPRKNQVHESPIMSDFGSRRISAFRKSGSNYDNLVNIWSSLRGRTGEKRSIDNSSIGSNGSGGKCQTSGVQLDQGNVFDQDLKRLTLRRVHSFNSESSINKTKDSSKDRKCDLASGYLTVNSDMSQSSPKDKERRVTIAVYDNARDTTLPYQSDQSNNTSDTLNETSVTDTTVYETEDHFTDCSENVSAVPFVAGFGVHPEHKIYTKAILSKNSLKNVINKLTNTRKSLATQHESGVSGSQHSDLEKSGEKIPSKLVYTMARQCTKSLKERIKQIRSEDEGPPIGTTTPITGGSAASAINNKSGKPGDNTCIKAREQISALPQYQQGSSSIGAKLASSTDTGIYQMPRSKNLIIEDTNGHSTSCGQGTNADHLNLNNAVECEQNSTTDIECVKRSLELNELRKINAINLDDSSGSLEEFEDDNSGGDSYYERSFEVIEDLLENDLFRDSAIYSDPEDPDGKMNPADLSKGFPRSILNRVSKSPSLRSDRFNYSGRNSLPRNSVPTASKTVDNCVEDCSSNTDTNNRVSRENSPEVTSVSGALEGASSQSDDPQSTESTGGRSHSPSPTSTKSVLSTRSNSLTSDATTSSEAPENKINDNNGIVLLSHQSCCIETKDDNVFSNDGKSKLKDLEQQPSSTLITSVQDKECVNPPPIENPSTNFAIESSTKIPPRIITRKVLSISPTKIVSNKLSASSHCASTSSEDHCSSSKTFSDASPAVSAEMSLGPNTKDINIIANSPKKSNNPSPVKKVPPPVPAKPDSVRSKTSRNCGSKILSHLKSLEECSRFAKADNLDTTLEGVKSLQERRKELVTWTGGNTDLKQSNSGDESHGRENCQDCSGESCTCKVRKIATDEESDTITIAKTVQSNRIKPPQSPLMSVRSFVSRNVASVANMRSSRATTKLSSNQHLKSPPAVPPPPQPTKIREECSSSEETEASDTKRSTFGQPAHGISITRRKSIKTLGSYISKLNTRSSSVPPRLHKKFESRQSSLPSDSLDPTQPGGAGSDEINQETLGDSEQSMISPKQFMITKSSTVKVVEPPTQRRRMKTSLSFPVSFNSPPSSLPASPSTPSCVSETAQHSFLPPSPDDVGTEEEFSGVVIEGKRPRGWVRQVVGRLQQGDHKQQQQGSTCKQQGGS